MKLTLLIVCLVLVSAIVFARDLSSIARKERARREMVEATAGRSKTLTNADLDAYPEVKPPPARKTRGSAPAERDLAKEEAFWRREAIKHRRERARLEASIRRLEWRLRDREARAATRSTGGLREDPAVALIEQSLQSLREERDGMEMEFRERARKARAFPGWLR